MENILRVLKVIKTAKVNDGVSPMTYAKLKELGYESKDWQNWSDEEKVKRSQEQKQQSKEQSSKEEQGKEQSSKKEGSKEDIDKILAKQASYKITTSPSDVKYYKQGNVKVKKVGAGSYGQNEYEISGSLNDFIQHFASIAGYSYNPASTSYNYMSRHDYKVKRIKEGLNDLVKKGVISKEDFNTVSKNIDDFVPYVYVNNMYNSKAFTEEHKKYLESLTNKEKADIDIDCFHLSNEPDDIVNITKGHGKDRIDAKLKITKNPDSMIVYPVEGSKLKNAMNIKEFIKDSTDVTDALTDEEIDQLIKEEEDAIASYEAALKVAVSPVAKDRLQHILEEEQEHVQELRNLKAQPTHDSEKNVYEIKNEAGHYVVYKNNIRFASCDSFSEAVKEIKDDGGNA